MQLLKSESYFRDDSESIYATGTGNAGGKGFLVPLPVQAAKEDRQKLAKKGENITYKVSRLLLFHEKKICSQ